ncbi:MAG: YaaR family protein [Spirochaetales bacterium]|jgi:uncharacterized protein YaaR (DUF327 family)|nr:YaaR family protein [Spirochaetales bacterium]
MDILDPLQTGLAGASFSPPPQKGRISKKAGPKTSFKAILAASVEEPPETDLPLEELLDELHQRGEKLSQSPTMTEVIDYKRAVRNFVRHVMEHGFGLETREGVKFSDPLKPQKQYTIVKIVDEKLEKLAARILRNQESRLDILAAVNEIQGLLVDLIR